jgi:hypothetical protein
MVISFGYISLLTEHLFKQEITMARHWKRLHHQRGLFFGSNASHFHKQQKNNYPTGELPKLVYKETLKVTYNYPTDIRHPNIYIFFERPTTTIIAG